MRLPCLVAWFAGGRKARYAAPKKYKLLKLLHGLHIGRHLLPPVKGNVTFGNWKLGRCKVGKCGVWGVHWFGQDVPSVQVLSHGPKEARLRSRRVAPLRESPQNTFEHRRCPAPKN